MRAILRSIHKYLESTFALTAISRVDAIAMPVFHGTMDEALLRNCSRAPRIWPLDSDLEKPFAEHPGSGRTCIRASRESRNLFELLSANHAGRTNSIRVDGEGSILRERPQDHHNPATSTIRMARALCSDVAEAVRRMVVLVPGA